MGSHYLENPWISQFSSVAQSVQLFLTPWTAERQASLSVKKSRSLLKLMSIESVMPSNNLILCGDAIQQSHPSPPTFNLSQHQGLS